MQIVLENNIKKERFALNDMTQEELAKAVDVSRQTIISVEKGKYVPSVLLALKIAKHFGKPLEEIFYLREEA